MFDIDHYSVMNKKGLEEELGIFFKSSNKPKLLEIFTNSKLNDVVLKNYFKYL
jgi:2-succinyl-5-enolpyruvyl-6-hydroxy-3-cyclohexene-1-carboxylate synthase